MLRHQLSSDNMTLSPFMPPVPNVKIQDSRMSSSAEDFLSRRGSSGIAWLGQSRSAGNVNFILIHHVYYL